MYAVKNEMFSRLYHSQLFQLLSNPCDPFYDLLFVIIHASFIFMHTLDLAVLCT